MNFSPTLIRQNNVVINHNGSTHGQKSRIKWVILHIQGWKTMTCSYNPSTLGWVIGYDVLKSYPCYHKSY